MISWEREFQIEMIFTKKDCLKDRVLIKGLEDLVMRVTVS